MLTGNLSEISLEIVVDAIEGNLFELFKSFGALPGAEIDDSDNVHALQFLTGLDSPMFNGVAHSKFSSEGNLGDAIEELLAPFKARGVPMFWWTGPATQPIDLDEQLQAYGMVINMVDTPGLALDLTTLSDKLAAPEGLTIDRACSGSAPGCQAAGLQRGCPPRERHGYQPVSQDGL